MSIAYLSVSVPISNIDTLDFCSIYYHVALICQLPIQAYLKRHNSAVFYKGNSLEFVLLNCYTNLHKAP